MFWKFYKIFVGYYQSHCENIDLHQQWYCAYLERCWLQFIYKWEQFQNELLYVEITPCQNFVNYISQLEVSIGSLSIRSWCWQHKSKAEISCSKKMFIFHLDRIHLILILFSFCYIGRSVFHNYGQVSKRFPSVKWCSHINRWKWKRNKKMHITCLGSARKRKKRS